MKTVNKLLFALMAVSTLFFASCDEEITREPSPIIPEDCAAVYFPKAEVSDFEIDPTSGITSFDVVIARKDSVDELTVNVNVEINDSSVFVVPETVTFAATQKQTTFTVTFPTAAEGITYNLKLSVSGESIVNPYEQSVSFYESSLTLIKWTRLDTKFIWIDGIVTKFYGASTEPFYVTEIDKAELGNLIRYRCTNVYRADPAGHFEGEDWYYTKDVNGICGGYASNYPTDMIPGTYYTIIEIDTKANTAFMSSHEMGFAWGYGMFSTGSVYGNLSSDAAKYPLGKVADNVITFGANSLYASMADYNAGGKYPCSNPTIIYMTLEAYQQANMKIKDYNDVAYDWVAGEIGEFHSDAFSQNFAQDLYMAIDIDSTNEESEYKDLYYLPDL